MSAVVPGEWRRVLLARHGQTADNAEGLILGHRDPPLSAIGRDQADALAAAARKAQVVAVWSSPLQRARVTAERVARACDAELAVLEELMESDRGDWEGRALAELAEQEPQRFGAFEAAAADFAFPGGETLADQVTRTRVALDHVVTGATPALVVAHVGTIRAARLARGLSVGTEAEVPHGELIALDWPVGPGQS